MSKPYTFVRAGATRAVTMLGADDPPWTNWSGSYDPTTGIVTLIGKRVDPWAIDRWVDDGGRAR